MKEIKFRLFMNGEVHMTECSGIVDGESGLARVSAEFPTELDGCDLFIVFRVKRPVKLIDGTVTKTMEVDITDGPYTLPAALIAAEITEVAFRAKSFDSSVVYLSKKINFPSLAESLPANGSFPEIVPTGLLFVPGEYIEITQRQLGSVKEVEIALNDYMLGIFNSLEDFEGELDTALEEHDRSGTAHAALTEPIYRALEGKAETAAVPAKTSELENDSGYVTADAVPSRLSELTNDTGFISADSATALSSSAVSSHDQSGTAHAALTEPIYRALEGKAEAAAVPAKTSELENDSGYVTADTVPAAADSIPLAAGIGSAGESLLYSRADHVHPSSEATGYEKLQTTDGWCIKFPDGTGFWYGEKSFTDTGFTANGNVYATSTTVSPSFSPLSGDVRPTAIHSITVGVGSEGGVWAGGCWWSDVLSSVLMQAFSYVSGTRNFTGRYQLWGSWR